jgi:hypothetical protein
LEELTQATNIFATELDEAGYSNYDFTPDNSPYDLSFLSLEGLSAREDLITAAMNILRLARGPQERLTTFAGTVSSSDCQSDIQPSSNHDMANPDTGS